MPEDSGGKYEGLFSVGIRRYHETFGLEPAIEKLLNGIQTQRHGTLVVHYAPAVDYAAVVVMPHCKAVVSFPVKETEGVDVSFDGEKYTVEAYGTPAHASTPSLGDNAHRVS